MFPERPVYYDKIVLAAWNAGPYVCLEFHLLPRFSLWPSLLLMLLVLTASALLVVGCVDSGGEEDAQAPASLEELPPEFAKLAEVWALLEEKHIDSGSIDPQAAADGAIRGMMDSLDDPHASYLAPDQYSMMRQDIQGYFEGIGAEVGVRNGLITIVAPRHFVHARTAGHHDRNQQTRRRTPEVLHFPTPAMSSLPASERRRAHQGWMVLRRTDQFQFTAARDHLCIVEAPRWRRRPPARTHASALMFTSPRTVID